MCWGGEENGEFPPKIPMSPFQSLAQPSASRLYLKTKQKVGRVGGEPLFTKPTLCETSESFFQDTGHPRQRGRGGEKEEEEGLARKESEQDNCLEKKKKQLHTPPTTPPSSLRPFSLAAAAGFQEQDRWVANKQHGGKTRVISSMLRSRAAPRCSLKRRCILFPPTACNLVVQLSSLPSIPPSSIKKKHCLRAVRHQQQQQPCRLLLLRGSGIHGI